MRTMLTTLVVLLAAATVAVPLTRRAGFGSVLGYLLAGIVIGPAGLRLITDVDAIASIAGLGVVMLLFLIGLEVRPQRLWVMRRSVFGLGTAQVVDQRRRAGGSCPCGGRRLAGRDRARRGPGDVFHRDRPADAGGTRSAHQPCRPRRLRRAAVPGSGIHSAGRTGAAARRRQPSRPRAVAGCRTRRRRDRGHPDRRPLPHASAVPRHRRRQDAGSLHRRRAAHRCGHRLLATLARTVPSLGAFMAGVLLSESEYRHELQADIAPFEGLLLGFFFISVGMSADLQLAGTQPVLLVEPRRHCLPPNQSSRLRWRASRGRIPRMRCASASNT